MLQILLLQRLDAVLAASLSLRQQSSMSFLTCDPRVSSTAQSLGLTAQTNFDRINFSGKSRLSHEVARATAIIDDFCVASFLGDIFQLDPSMFTKWFYTESLYFNLQKNYFKTIAECFWGAAPPSVLTTSIEGFHYLDSGLPAFHLGQRGYSLLTIEGNGLDKYRPLAPDIQAIVAILAEKSFKVLALCPGVSLTSGHSSEMTRDSLEVPKGDVILLPSLAHNWIPVEGVPFVTYDNAIASATDESYYCRLNAHINFRDGLRACLEKLHAWRDSPIFQRSFFEKLVTYKCVFFTAILESLKKKKVHEIVLSDLGGGLNAVLASVAEIRGLPVKFLRHSQQLSNVFSVSRPLYYRAADPSPHGRQSFGFVRSRDLAQPAIYAGRRLEDKAGELFTAVRNIDYRSIRVGVVLNTFFSHNFILINLDYLRRFIRGLISQCKDVYGWEVMVRPKPHNYCSGSLGFVMENKLEHVSHTGSLQSFIDDCSFVIGVGSVSSALFEVKLAGKTVIAAGDDSDAYSFTDSCDLLNRLQEDYFSRDEVLSILEKLNNLLGTARQ